jgi:hypothetical protein
MSYQWNQWLHNVVTFFAGNAFEFKETHPFVRDTLKGWIHEIRWAWKEYYRIGLIEDISSGGRSSNKAIFRS